MIRNDALAERLNLHKSGKPYPEEPPAPTIIEQEKHNEEILENSMVVQIANYVIDIVFFFTKCIAYGYSLNVVFHTGWKFVPMFAIGFSIEVLTSKILDAFRKN